jgi:hypothetical protein
MAWVREQTIPRDRRLSKKLVSTVADRGCHVVSVMDPSGRNIDFLGRSRYFLFHEAEWTPFQTHYFSENLVAPGIGPGPLDS